MMKVWCLVILVLLPLSLFQISYGNAYEEKQILLKALKLKGDIQRGALIYEEACEACHYENAVGDPAGTFPQLAGQHGNVIIKQMAEIAGGFRVNFTMLPYSTTKALVSSTEDLFKHPLTSTQALADIAAYLASLPISINTTKGPGKSLDKGKKLFESRCSKCHGVNGKGKAVASIPALAGQNYNYLMRQIDVYNKGSRKKANPVMLRLMKGPKKVELGPVMDYLSRMK